MALTMLPFIGHVYVFQARNRAGLVGYVPEKYLQLPTSSSLLRMLQSFSSGDAQSHTSSTSAEQEPEIETLTQSSPNTHGSGETTGVMLVYSIIVLNAKNNLTNKTLHFLPSSSFAQL